MRDLRQLLEDLIESAAIDGGDEACGDYSPATNSIRNAIIERYGKVDNERSAGGIPLMSVTYEGLTSDAIRHLADAGVVGKVDSEQGK